MIRVLHEGRIWRARLEAPADGRPARKVVTGRRRRDTGMVSTRKAVRGGLVTWESTLESDLVVVEDLEPRTTTISHQPHTLHVWNEALEFRHTPDFLLGRRAGTGEPEVVEVKTPRHSEQPDMAERLAISEACHRAMGFEFSVRGPANIRIEPRLSNCHLLRRYRMVAVRPGVGHAVATLLGQAGAALSVEACVRAIDGDPRTRFELYALVCAGVLHLDLATPLSPMTVVTGCDLNALTSGNGQGR